LIGQLILLPPRLAGVGVGLWSRMVLIVSLVAAAVIGVAQLHVLGSATRSVRFRVALAAVGAGAYGAGALSLALEDADIQDICSQIRRQFTAARSKHLNSVAVYENGELAAEWTRSIDGQTQQIYP
jgi:hypothetical protein